MTTILKTERESLHIIVEGYTCAMQHSLYTQLIPNEINDLCFKYYFELCDNPAINYDRSEQLVKEGNCQEAIFEMSRSSPCKWKQTLITYYKSLKLVKEHKIQEAYHEMREMFQTNFQITTGQKYFKFVKRVYLYTREILIPLRKYTELESLISRLTRRDPTYAAVYLDIKAEGLQKQNKMDEALKIAQTNTKNYPNNQYFWITQSNILFEMQEYKQCKKCILQAIQLQPHDSNINEKYISLLRKFEEWKEIEEFTDKLIATCTDPNHVKYHYYKSDALQKQNKLDQALSIAERNVHYNPDKWMSCFRYALILFELKQYAKCKKYLLATMKLLPHDTSLYYFYIETLKKLGAAKELHSFCKELIRNHPNSAATYSACYMVCRWEKNNEYAIYNIKKAIDLDPYKTTYVIDYHNIL